MRRVALLVFFLVTMAVTTAYGSPLPATTPDSAPTCDALRAAKSKVYGYHIAQLTEDQIEAKGKELDTFWKQVQAAGPDGVACIRNLLAEEKTDHIFQFDAASMLFPADHSLETFTLIRDSLAQADFQESDPAN